MEGSGQLRAAKLFLRTCSLALIHTSPGQLPTAFRGTAAHSKGGQIGHLWPWWPWLTWQGLGYPSSHLRALVFSSPSFSASSLVEPGPSQSFCALINLLEGEGDAAFLGTKPDHSKQLLNHKGGQGRLKVLFFSPSFLPTFPPSFVFFFFPTLLLSPFPPFFLTFFCTLFPQSFSFSLPFHYNNCLEYKLVELS